MVMVMDIEMVVVMEMVMADEVLDEAADVRMVVYLKKHLALGQGLQRQQQVLWQIY